MTIKNFAFSPQPLKTTSGTTITVRNVDTSTHTFTADDKSFDAGEIPAGSVKTVRVSGKGTVGYHCQIHDYMKGALAFG